MDFVTPILFAVALINLALALVVFGHRPAQAVNRVFAVTGVSVALWTLTNALFRLSPSLATATLWAQLSYVAALMTAASLLQFSRLYPANKEKSKDEKLKSEKSKTKPQGETIALILLWAAAAFLSGLAFLTDAVIRDIDLSTGRIITNGGIYFIALFMLLSLGTAFATFYSKQKRTRGLARAQARYVLTGSALTAVIGLFCNLLLPLGGNYGWVWLGPVSSLFFVGFSVYSIVAHHLFDIRVLIRRTLVYALLLSGLTALFSVLVLVLTNALQSLLGTRTPTFFINLVAALGIGLGVEPLRHWLERVTDGFLFQREQQEQALLIQLARRLSQVSLRDEVLEVLGETVHLALRPQKAACYLWNGDSENAHRVDTAHQIDSAQLDTARNTQNLRPVPDTSLLKLSAPELHRLSRLAIETPGAVVEEQLSRKTVVALYLPDTPQNTHTTENGDKSSQTPIGVLLFLAGRKSGEAYTSADHELLEAIGTQVSSALQRAHLIVGDHEKSEFVSIAAHELLTPVTAIDGYTSLILDDKMGTVDDQAAKYLHQIQLSSRRLSGLVKDLLSLSRLEAGRITFVPQALSVETLIEDVADQLRLSAQNKGLTLTVIDPTKALPRAWADPDRVTQILINLVGNAIKYTPQGSVTVTLGLEVDDKRINDNEATSQLRIAITDSGLGMSREAQQQLFQKFYRVSSPERENIPGTGLGLYITKAMVERMGGRITLHSEEGHGSTFAFTLPVASSHQSAPSVATTPVDSPVT